MSRRTPRVGIIGAGMSGICLAAKLRAAEVDDVVLYEKADELGGTWRDNTYPGVACDVPSEFYQYTFSPNPSWSHLLSPGPEIKEYLGRVADDQGVTRLIRFGTELTRAEHVDGRWRLSTAEGPVDDVDFLVSATGILHHPHYPDLAGMDSFAGACFHSARWDHSVPLAGRRVGVVGTGSTGAQIIAALADQVERLVVFQRTPQWVMPTPNPDFSGPIAQRLFRIPGLKRAAVKSGELLLDVFIEAVTHPGWQRTFVSAWARQNLRSVKDPVLRAKLTPDFEPMCRRLVISHHYYEALQRPNVEVVTDTISQVEPAGVRTTDGILHELDVLVLATGFDAHAYVRPMELVGPTGITLDQAWSQGPRAYRTVAQPGFPNYFTIMGPHSPVGNFSLTTIAETQAVYVLRWVQEWRAGRVELVEPTQEATDAFNADVRRAAATTIWATGGCSGWYLGQDGLPELWPWHPREHAAMLGDLRPDDFHLTLPAATP